MNAGINNGGISINNYLLLVDRIKEAVEESEFGHHEGVQRYPFIFILFLYTYYMCPSGHNN